VLARVRTGRGPGTAVVPLVVLTDLVSSGVAAADAAGAVASLLRPGAGAPATDEAMLALRAEVAADVAGGAAPGVALWSRVRSRTDTASPLPDPSPPVPGRRPGVAPDPSAPGVP
jgi:hypothetical protein